MIDLVPFAQIEAEKGKRSLKKFIQLAWSQVEPARPFKDNWHIDAMCEHLEAVSRGEIRRLVINVPPGSMKSLTCSVFWPAWSWTHSPHFKWITASYAQVIARRDGVRARRLIDTEWYQQRWGKMFRANDDDWSSMRYSNDQGGIRLSTTVGGAVTGDHADGQLADDPIKPADAPGEKLDTRAIEANVEWWDETMTSRMADPITSVRVMLMQRLHPNDLTGHVFKNAGYDHLCLPMTMERKCSITIPHRCSMPEDGRGRPTEPTSIGFKDPREEGNLLWPERFPEHVVEERKKEMGPMAHAAQDQQRPAPASGSIIKKAWIQYYRELPKVDKLIASWDMTFKETKKGSFVVGQVWAKCGVDFYLVDQYRARVDFNATLAAVKQQLKNYPGIKEKLIEDKANGPAIISALEKSTSGILAVPVGGSKEARMSAVSYLFASGNVYLPHPDDAPWVEDDYVPEITTFPKAPNDDQADATSQALEYLSNLYEPPEDIDMGVADQGSSEFLAW